MDISQYNFPEGTIIEVEQKEGGAFYTLKYESIEKTETVFGLLPNKAFSSGNYNFDIAISTLKSTLESNGYNFETNIWQ